MNLVIPPDVWLQAAVAFLAGLSAVVLGIVAMHRSWRHHDSRAERDFILGMTVLLVGVSWFLLSLAIVGGSVAVGNEQEDAIQELVVFVNAAVRLAVLLLAAHVLWDAVMLIRQHREAR